MRSTTRTTAVAIAFLLLPLAGCFSLGRDTPPLEQYVLGGVPTADVEATAGVPGGLAIGVRRLDLAPYLATQSIVVRREPHEVVHSEFHRWGEDLAEGITRALASYLAAGGPVRAVDVAPWPVRSRHDYLVHIRVSRFEGVLPGEPAEPTGEARVVAAWEIIRPADDTVVARGTTDYRESGWRVGDFASLVALLDLGLIALSRQLLSSLDTLQRGS